MMKSFSVTCCLLLLVSCGCGSSPDSLVSEQIGLMNEMADAMENDAPPSELEELQVRNASLREKFDALDLSTTEKRELMARHQDELVAATKRLQAAMMKKAMNSLGEGFPGFSPSGFPGFGAN